MKVLLAVDGSPCSKLAIESIASRTWPADTRFKVLTVLEPFHPELAGWHSGLVPIAIEAQQERLNEARALVDDTAAILAHAVSNLPGDEYAKLEIEREVMEGSVKDKIVECARQWPADMIVMGSHGRSGVEKLFLGSVSQAVLDDAPCTVEIVKAKG